MIRIRRTTLFSRRTLSLLLATTLRTIRRMPRSTKRLPLRRSSTTRPPMLRKRSPRRPSSSSASCLRESRKTRSRLTQIPVLLPSPRTLSRPVKLSTSQSLCAMRLCGFRFSTKTAIRYLARPRGASLPAPTLPSPLRQTSRTRSSSRSTRTSWLFLARRPSLPRPSLIRMVRTPRLLRVRSSRSLTASLLLRATPSRLTRTPVRSR